MENGKAFPGRRPPPKGTDSFVRPTSSLRNWITKEGEFLPEPKRYVLYISLACPWASGTYLFRSLFKLESEIEVAIVCPKFHDDNGWSWEGEENIPGTMKDPVVPDRKYLHQVYSSAEPTYSGNVTVPVLFDRKTGRIVSNESIEIMKMMNNEFSSFWPSSSSSSEKESLAPRPDFYPQDRRKEIDELNEFVYAKINNGVYKSGFARSQEAYEEAVRELFQALDEMEKKLSKSRYLLGNEQPTLVDFRLFLTLVRFDPVYHGHFKCNWKRIEDYPNLSNFVRDIYQMEGVAATVNMEHVQEHYYWSHESVNPKRIVVLGGVSDLSFPHDRHRFQPHEVPVSDKLKKAGTTDAEYLASAPLVKGTFKRGTSGFRTKITLTGQEESSLPAEKGRYHLYIANNCPWCHRAALVRSIKKLEDVVSMDVLFYRRDPERGWQFNPEEPGFKGDSAAGGIKYIKELYEREGSKEGSVPVLYDKKMGKIVNNESSEIIRFFDSAFEEILDTEKKQKQKSGNSKEASPGSWKLVPPSLQNDIDAWNAWTYTTINNGAYKAGFASTQEAYELGYHRFFAALDKINDHLRHRKYLLSDDLPTEADIRLFPTLFRFDHVYFIRFKLNKKMMKDYEHLQRWLKDLWSFEEIRAASNLDDCKKGYFGRTGQFPLVPVGPSFEFAQ